jgi:hypothetical protein
MLAIVALCLAMACRNSSYERISGSGPQADFVVTLTTEQFEGGSCVPSQQCTGHFAGSVNKLSGDQYVAAPNTKVFTSLQSDVENSSEAGPTATTDATGNFVLDWTFELPVGNVTLTFCGGSTPRTTNQGCARLVVRG